MFLFTIMSELPLELDQLPSNRILMGLFLRGEGVKLDLGCMELYLTQ